MNFETVNRLKTAGGMDRLPNMVLTSQNPRGSGLQILEGKYKGKRFKNEMEMNKFLEEQRKSTYGQRFNI